MRGHLSGSVRVFAEIEPEPTEDQVRAGVEVLEKLRPDLIVAGIMASLFLTSSVKILLQARDELRHVAEDHAPSHAHTH